MTGDGQIMKTGDVCRMQTTIFLKLVHVKICQVSFLSLTL